MIWLKALPAAFRLHEFKWHGTDPDNKTRMIPGKDKFNQLAVIPEQFYYNVRFYMFQNVLYFAMEFY